MSGFSAQLLERGLPFRKHSQKLSSHFAAVELELLIPKLILSFITLSSGIGATSQTRIFVNFPKMFKSITYTVTQLLASSKRLIRNILEIFCMSLLPDHPMDYQCPLCTTGNRVTSGFKSDQIREPSPKIPEPIQKTHPYILFL